MIDDHPIGVRKESISSVGITAAHDVNQLIHEEIDAKVTEKLSGFIVIDTF